jgi:hypothetical protein
LSTSRESKQIPYLKQAGFLEKIHNLGNAKHLDVDCRSSFDVQLEDSLLHVELGFYHLRLENLLDGNLALTLLFNEAGRREEELRLGDFEVVAFSQLFKGSQRIDFGQSVGSSIHHEHC